MLETLCFSQHTRAVLPHDFLPNLLQQGGACSHGHPAAMAQPAPEQARQEQSVFSMCAHSWCAGLTLIQLHEQRPSTRTPQHLSLQGQHGSTCTSGLQQPQGCSVLCGRGSCGGGWSGFPLSGNVRWLQWCGCRHCGERGPCSGGTSSCGGQPSVCRWGLSGLLDN